MEVGWLDGGFGGARKVGLDGGLGAQELEGWMEEA